MRASLKEYILFLWKETSEGKKTFNVVKTQLSFCINKMKSSWSNCAFTPC